MAEQEVARLSLPELLGSVRLRMGAGCVLMLVLAYALCLIPFLSERWLFGSIWVGVLLAIVVSAGLLLRLYVRSGPILCVLIFMFTYYLAPLPYFLWGIPIVPYLDNVSNLHFVRTWSVMAVFLVWVVFFTMLSRSRDNSDAPANSTPQLLTRDIGIFGDLFWLGMFAFIALTFKGEAIVNVSGADNYDTYISNLKGQSGALEYFLILMAVARVITVSLLQRICYVACVSYYLYFCFTRGYRVQMLEMSLLVAAMHCAHLMSFRNVVLASIAGFFLLQAHGFMKSGASDWQSLFTVMAGDQVRSNQTEVFYTSNNVVNAIFDGLIPVSERFTSTWTAMLASFLPGNLLPETWHSTLAAQGVTQLEGGGGGFIAGHYYFWASHVGVMLAGLLVTCLFRTYERTRSQRTLLLSILLLATCPRWIAYEPVAMFFRLGLYFLLIYEVMRLIPGTEQRPLPVTSAVSQ